MASLFLRFTPLQNAGLIFVTTLVPLYVLSYRWWQSTDWMEHPDPELGFIRRSWFTMIFILVFAASLASLAYVILHHIDRRTPLFLVQFMAQQGNAAAETELGIRYRDGLAGVEKDDPKALGWFLDAALQGNAIAQNYLGRMYFLGEGVTKDPEQAVSWYKMSAAQGYAKAEDNMGDCYLYGTGVQQDYAQAFTFFQKAAAQGDALAERYLGYIYETGRGVPIDYARALDFFQKSAAQEDACAEYHIGWIYEKGLGVPANLATAREWYEKAAAAGCPEAIAALKALP